MNLLPWVLRDMTLIGWANISKASGLGCSGVHMGTTRIPLIWDQNAKSCRIAYKTVAHEGKKIKLDTLSMDIQQVNGVLPESGFRSTEFASIISYLCVLENLYTLRYVCKMFLVLVMLIV